MPLTSRVGSGKVLRISGFAGIAIVRSSSQSTAMCFAIVFAETASPSRNRLSWRPYPKYGTTAVRRRAPASRIASARRNCSTIIGSGCVVWTRTTCSPVTGPRSRTYFQPQTGTTDPTEECLEPGAITLGVSRGLRSLPCAQHEQRRKKDSKRIRVLQDQVHSPGPQIGSAAEVVVGKNANVVMPQALEHRSEIEGVDWMTRGSTLSHYIPRTHGAVLHHCEMAPWTDDP